MGMNCMIVTKPHHYIISRDHRRGINQSIKLCQNKYSYMVKKEIPPVPVLSLSLSPRKNCYIYTCLLLCCSMFNGVVFLLFGCILFSYIIIQVHTALIQN